jgi:hypothetical protein
MAKVSQSLSGIEQAAKNIVALINERPRSPTEAEIARAISSGLYSSAPSSAHAEINLSIRQIVHAITESEIRLVALSEGTPAYSRQEAFIDGLWEKLDTLGSKLPTTPQSFEDLLTIAEVAYYWADKEPDGAICSLNKDADCPREHWAARLIFAVMSLGGRIHA